MRKYNLSVYFSSVSRIILTIIFILSGLSKLLFPSTTNELRDLLNLFIHISDAQYYFFQATFSILEVLIGIFFLTFRDLKYLLIISMGLALIFILINITRFLYLKALDCGCFGDVFEISITDILIIDFAILLLSMLTYQSRYQTNDK